MKKLLITGGSGTLGNALVKHLYGSCQITIYSRSELLQAQMRQKYPDCRYILGDVRDRYLLSAAIAGHDTVIHAAAMKRIPECEIQPGICHEVNVIGSEYVAHACNVHGVEQCIGISTDKACQAVTVYGASKLMMERIFQSFPILKERAKQQAGTLSGGEQQMLAIARGLMSNPKLMLLDEPSLGLAPLLVEEIFRIIREINKEGVTILLVEQNANMALQTAQYGYVMETGTIALHDTAENLIQNDYVRKVYLGAG